MARQLDYDTVASLFMGEMVPSWIRYPDVESVKWLNTLIDSLWPAMGQGLSDRLTKKLDAILEQKVVGRSAIATACVKELDLGGAGPNFTGFKGYRTTEQGFLEVDVQFGAAELGDWQLVLSLGMGPGGHIPLGGAVTDITFSGSLMLSLSLCTSLSLISSYSFTYRAASSRVHQAAEGAFPLFLCHQCRIHYDTENRLRCQGTLCRRTR